MAEPQHTIEDRKAFRDRLRELITEADGNDVDVRGAYEYQSASSDSGYEIVITTLAV